MLASVLESDIESVVRGSDQVDYFVIGSGTAGLDSDIVYGARSSMTRKWYR